MENRDIARILSEISEYLDMKDVPFKPRAYSKAADTVRDLEEDLSQIYKKEGIKGLNAISGVGASIAEKIEELIKTGKLKYYEELKKDTPVKLDELTRVEGLGPKKIKKLHEELGIRNLKDLEKAAKEHKIRDLEDFGPKTEENIKSCFILCAIIRAVNTGTNKNPKAISGPTLSTAIDTVRPISK